MFNASLAQRFRAFNYAPVVFTFIHWTMGVMYLFYISALFILIRDILRPGILWFIPDYNDPDFKPFQEVSPGPIPHFSKFWGLYVSSLIVAC